MHSISACFCLILLINLITEIMEDEIDVVPDTFPVSSALQHSRQATTAPSKREYHIEVSSSSFGMCTRSCVGIGYKRKMYNYTLYQVKSKCHVETIRIINNSSTSFTNSALIIV